MAAAPEDAETVVLAPELDGELDADDPRVAAEARDAGDTFVTGVAWLAGLTGLQKIIGLVRTVLVCRWLSPAELGQWELAFSFLVVVAPIVVLGIPGSYGRYVAQFASTGQLRSFVRQTIAACGVLLVLATLLSIVFRQEIAGAMFDRAADAQLIWLLAPCLAATIAFNALTSLLNALRLHRMCSVAQFLHCVIFAALCFALVGAWTQSAAGVAAAYGGACLISALPACSAIVRHLRALPSDTAALPAAELWRRILPFASWSWTANLVTNTFAVIDRYLLIHFGGLSAAASMAAVGQYHSARAIPRVFTQLGQTLGPLATPHLARDWDGQMQAATVVRLRGMMKWTSISLVAAGCAVLWVAPWLFEHLFEGKFEEGLALLPLTLAFSIWQALSLLAQNYLWCVERPGFGTLAYFLGLVLNVCLAIVLLPTYGLWGAVVATSMGHLAALLGVLLFNRRLGMQLPATDFLFVLLPAALCGGALTASLSVVGLVLAAWNLPWLMSDSEKIQMRSVWAAATRRAKRLDRRST